MFRFCISSMAGIAILVSVSGCAMPNGGGGEQVGRPDVAYRAPTLDFTKVKKVAVFPLFPAGVQDDQYAEQLVGSLTAEIEARQSQWEIMNYREVLQIVNEKGLGTGYRNLQADFNTFGGAGGQMVVSPATRQFLSQLHEATGADAFIIGSYTLSTQQVPHQSAYTGQVTMRNIETSKVFLSLYYPPEGRNWWVAEIARQGNRAAAIKQIAQSLGRSVGDGTLRQL